MSPGNKIAQFARGRKRSRPRALPSTALTGAENSAKSEVEHPRQASITTKIMTRVRRRPLKSPGSRRTTRTPAGETWRYARRREAILDAAANVFNEKGVRGATLADVALRVGLGATGITYYYRTKEHLAVACLLRTTASLDRLFARAAKAPSAAMRLSSAVTLYFDRLREMAGGRKPPW